MSLKKIEKNLGEVAELFHKGQPLGGGAGAGLSAYFGACLLARSVEYGSKDKKILAQLAEIQEKLVQSGWEDGQAFAAWQKDKDDLTKKDQVVEIPFQIALQAMELMELAVGLAKTEKVKMIADIRAAQELIYGAFYAALEMVRGNLEIFEIDEREELVERIDDLVSQFVTLNSEAA